jgi:hypothetical protein
MKAYMYSINTPRKEGTFTKRQLNRFKTNTPNLPTN